MVAEPSAITHLFTSSRVESLRSRRARYRDDPSKPRKHLGTGDPGTLAVLFWGRVLSDCDAHQERLPSGRSPHAIFDAEPWDRATLSDEERRVDPRVSRIAGLKARVGIEVLVVEVSPTGSLDRGHHRRVQLEQSDVLDV